MRSLMSVLGDPHLAFPVIHITGTNGKGSVARMLTRILMAAGLSVGTYTSPHLLAINERISRDLDPISDEELGVALSLVLDTEPLWRHEPSWFELVTATAFDWFASIAVDVAVVEVGLLGRWDATNVVESAVSVITNIGADHTDGGPGWELAVVGEKAGIVKPGTDVVIGPLAPELREVIAAEGPERMFVEGVDYGVLDFVLSVGGHVADLTTPYGPHLGLSIPVHGPEQVSNAAIAVMAAEAFFDRALADDLLAHAFDGLTLPARVEVLNHQPLVILDGAHNVPAAEALASTIRSEFHPLGSRILVVGVLAGRRPAELLAALAAAGFDAVICTTPPSPRGLPAAELADAARRVGLDPVVVEDPERAVVGALRHAGDDDMVVIAGSFYLVPAATAAVDAAFAAEPRDL